MTKASPLPWLLEAENPSVRYLALTGLLDRPPGDAEVQAARSAIPQRGPARAILDAQWPEGYWVGPGLGYSPKYRSTVWQVIFLAALGAPRTEVIDRACAYILDHSLLPDGRFSARRTAKGAVACLNGNLLRAMRQLGHEDPRLDESLEVLARTVVHNGFRCRFNATGAKEGSPPPRMGDGLPCAWGAIKVLGAIAQIPAGRRSPPVREAVEAGMAFLLGGDLAAGGYPAATRPSALWHQFGFPLGYTSDLLEALDVLARLGAGKDPRLAAAVEVVLSKRDDSGRWALAYTPERTWASFGRLGQPNKWVTLRALRALRGWGR